MCSLPPSSVALMMEAVNSFETSVNFYETTRRNIPEDSHFHLERLPANRNSKLLYQYKGNRGSCQGQATKKVLTVLMLVTGTDEELDRDDDPNMRSRCVRDLTSANALNALQ
jgi:hypothetical protein